MNEHTNDGSEMVELSDADLATVGGGADVVGGAVAAAATLGTGLLLISGGAIALGLAASVGFGAAWAYAEFTK